MTFDIKPSSFYNQENGGTIPIFTPTMNEFKNFKAFMESVEEYGKKAGIIKVVPPKEWKDQLPEFSTKLDQIKVTKPITQHIMGGRGVFTQTNIEDRKEYSLKEWHQICHQNQNRPPQISSNSSSKTNKSKPPLTAAAADQTSSPEQLDYAKITKSHSTTSHLTVEEYQDIERHYWRNITFNQPMYGADMLGTLFDSSVHAWNTNHLDNTLNNLGVTLPGVNSPYLYFGMWKATFAWHVEDMDLYSINYIHFGAPKQWYVIQPDHSKRFETFMRSTFFNQYKECHEFLRHKTFIVSPTVLQNNNIPVQKLVQQPGEFVITYPFGYHSGYNLDFNCAESVNFALDSWIEIGKKAKSCTCIEDAVKIDVDYLLGGGDGKEEIQDTEPVLQQKSGRKRRKIDKKKDICALCSDNEPSTKHTLLKSTSDMHTYAHDICAESITETYIKSGIVHGISDIPASRWKLVCIFCKKKGVGACMQCCYGKCWKSFHITCALKHGATLNRIEDGDAEYATSLYNGYCPQHDPKKTMEKKANQLKYIKDMADKLHVNRIVFVKWRGGGYYQGNVKECVVAKQQCRVQSVDGVVRSVPWRDISVDVSSDSKVDLYKARSLAA